MHPEPAKDVDELANKLRKRERYRYDPMFDSVVTLFGGELDMLLAAVEHRPAQAQIIAKYGPLTVTTADVIALDKAMAAEHARRKHENKTVTELCEEISLLKDRLVAKDIELRAQKRDSELADKYRSLRGY